MKKVSIIGIIIIIFTIFACIILNNGGKADALYLLNWGEYIDEELLIKFEEETGVPVIEETVTSSETMYQKITAGTTAYDVAIPGDYMVTKMYNEGLLYEIETQSDLYPNLKEYATMFNDDLTKIRKDNMSDTMTYCMPYFWGAYSMVYSTRKPDVVSVVANNGFKALFDRSLYTSNVNLGMYSTARWALSAYLMSNGINPNEENIDDAKAVSDIKKASFNVWGDDQLKRKTATGDLDVIFTQLGDFFDAVYLSLEEGLDTQSDNGLGLDGLEFNVCVPETTAAFFDAMVIPTTSKNTDLANKFIDFMLDSNNAYQNALAIGYSPTLKSVMDLFETDKDELYFEDEEDSSRNVTLGDLCEKYPVYLNPLVNSKNVYLFEPKESDYMTRCETIVNQAKASVNTESNAGTVVCFTVLGTALAGAASYGGFKGYKYYKKRKKANG